MKIAAVSFESRPDKIYHYIISDSQYKRYLKVQEVRSRVFAVVIVDTIFPKVVLIRSVRDIKDTDPVHKLKKIYGVVM